MDVPGHLDGEQREPGYLGLIGLVVGLGLGGVVLFIAGGPPHLPRTLPSWSVITATLQGSSLPLDAIAYVLTTLAWLVWFWIVASILLRLLVVAADGLAHGASWVAALWALSDRATLPLVRRAVDGALVAVFVVNMVSRTVPGAAAASLPTVPVHAAAIQSRATAQDSPPQHSEKRSPRDLEYAVQPGDTLWGIAERFYRSGEEYPRLVAANVGHRMLDGEYFSQAGVIQPGWVLLVPLPSPVADEENGVTYYVVEEGDTLQSIATRLLGDEDHWTQLFKLNRGEARLNGDVFSDPNLIWPGLRLRVPVSSEQAPAHRTRPPVGGATRTGRQSRHRPARARITPTPTRVPATATPLPRATPPPPTVAATSVSPPTGSKEPEVGLPGNEVDLIAGIAGAAAVIVAGSALAARRRARRSLDEPPIPPPPPRRPVQEFVDMDSAGSLVPHVPGADNDTIPLLAFQVYRFFARHDIQTITVLLAEQERDHVTLILKGGMEDKVRIVELAGELEQRLGGRLRVDQTTDGDLALEIEGTKLLRLMAPIADRGALPPLLPLGALSGDSTLYGNWRELGNVLIAAMPGGGAEVVLESLLGTLAARQSPSHLRLWTIADHRALPLQLRGLPHQHAAIDPVDEIAVARVLDNLRSELRKRIRDVEKSGEPWSPSREQPELVLIVGEFGDLPDNESILELVATNGPAQGIRVVAASTRAETIDEHTLGYFRTRLVLQAFEDDESTHVLGQPEASDLGSGEFFLRIDQRRPIRLRGFRISPDYLDQLVHLMRQGRNPVVWTPLEEREDRATVEEASWEEAPAQPELYSPTDTPAHPEVESRPQEAEAESPRSEARELEAETELPEAGQPAPGSSVTCDDSESGEKSTSVAPLNGKRQQTLETTVLVGASGGVVADELTVDGADKAKPEEAALIWIQCFGDFVVRSAEQAISPSGGEKASYKAWELLAFLASQPGGTVSKEKLLEAIWPDFGGERVTNKVHAALVRLRALLARQVPGIPSDVVRLDRDGTCRLDTTQVISDVHEFVSLLHAARSLPRGEAIGSLERVRQLYKGELLSGRETREYEWVCDRNESGVTLREHYREEYRRATKRLARLYREEGRADRAVPLLKELLQAEPTLEDVVRDLYRCYRDLGDLTSLTREDRHLRQALRDIYGSLDTDHTEDVPPEPETVALFEEIRNQLDSAAADCPVSGR